MTSNFKIISRKAKVSCCLSGDDWKLYTASLDCTPAVHALNTWVMRLAQSVDNREEFLSGMAEITARLGKYGADDTPPRGVLYDIATEIYGPEDD